MNRRFHERMDTLLADRVAGTTPSLNLDDFAGTYRDALYGDVIVEASNGRFMMRFSKSPSFEGPLEHWHHDAFVVRWGPHSNADAFVTFSLGTDGAVEAMELRPFSPAADSARLRGSFVPAHAGLESAIVSRKALYALGR